MNTKDLIAERERKFARYCLDDEDIQADERKRRGLDEPVAVAVDIQCPECGAWLYPTAYVKGENEVGTIEHDVRCGCLDKVPDRDAYILALCALVNDQARHGYTHEDFER